jgi:hypothetical protein
VGVSIFHAAFRFDVLADQLVDRHLFGFLGVNRAINAP